MLNTMLRKLVILLTAALAFSCVTIGRRVPSRVDQKIYDSPPAKLFVTDGFASTRISSGLSLERPEYGRTIFEDESYTWFRGARRFRHNGTLKSALHRREPITTHFEQSGYIYALLWRWDYGFLRHLPQALSGELNGWSLVESSAARVRSAPDPYHWLPLYRKPVAAGLTELPARNYIGQWIYVGFDPAPVATDMIEARAPTVVASTTRHNVVRPGQRVEVDSGGEITDVSLFRDGQRMNIGHIPDLVAPEEAGRYALRITEGDTGWTVPLTVGFERPGRSGWESTFFPIHFYNGWGYVGVFEPNRSMRKDVETIAMLELGANTFFVSGENELIDALGARQILNIRKDTRYIAREIEDASVTEPRFTNILQRLMPFDPTTLGLYVEDEPPAETLEDLTIFERTIDRIAPEIELLYTVHGPERAQFWNTAGTSARMFRSYPIRKARRDDLIDSVMSELANRLADAQRDSEQGRAWLVAQSFGDLGKPGLWDLPTPAEMRLMVNLSLARGLRGLTYFCFDSSPRAREWLLGLARWPFVPESELYYEVGRINQRIESMGATLAELEWVGPAKTKDVRFDVQILNHTNGDRYAWMTNLSTSEDVRHTLIIPGFKPVDVDLEPGDGILVLLHSVS